MTADLDYAKINKSVNELSKDVVSLNTTAENINKELKRLRNKTTTDKVFNVLIGLALLAVILICFSSLKELQRDNRASSSASSGVACVIEMLEEHRFAQRAAHEAQAAHEGYEYTIPKELAAPSQVDIEALKDRLAEKCAKIIAP